MFELFHEYFAQITTAFIDPKKRVFVGYLLVSLLMACCWMAWRQQIGIVQILKNIFSPSIWFSASAKADYKIFCINQWLMLLLSPLLVTQLVVATAIFYSLYEFFPARDILLSQWSEASVGILFTCSYFLLDDFSRFYVHRLLHKLPSLWAFHKVHHSAEALTPMTVFRTHPVESVLFSLRSTLVQAIAIGGFVFFLGDRADLTTVLGASIFVFIFNILGANLRHSHISIYYWKPLEKVLMSPAQHHIHHSVAMKHRDKNFGVVLSIWDYLWGSLHHSEKESELIFGLDESISVAKRMQYHSLSHIYFTPFIESGACLKRTAQALVKPLVILMRKALRCMEGLIRMVKYSLLRL